MSADTSLPPAITWSSSDLAGQLSALCPAHRIDLAGAVSLPCELPHRQHWLDWVAAGRHGDLNYLIRDPEGRADPTRRNPRARTLLVFAQRYTNGWPQDDPDPSAGGPNETPLPWIHRVSRYARGLDYHDVLLGDIKGLLKELRREITGLEAYPSTDTGPYLEREYAWLAGLGFLGHNRCLIHEKLGSGLFLGVALTNLDLTGLPEPGTPVVEPLYGIEPRRLHPPVTAPVDLCGSCTRCVDACPSSALDLNTGLDAHRCLSTWTIEWQGQAPAESAHLQGGLLFGCDICQSVCPWNNRAAAVFPDLAPVRSEYAALPEHAELDLEALNSLDDAEFRRRFRRTPLWRCHPKGMRRNARTVRANLKRKKP